MAKTASVNFIKTFDPVVHQAYQTGAKLSGTTRMRKTNGESHQFPLIGKTIAKQRIPGTAVQPQPISQTNVVVTPQNFSVEQYSATEDIEKMNYDERREIAEAQGYALGRREDQFKIDAMSLAGADVVATAVGGGNGLNIGKLNRASRLMNEKGVPMMDRHFAVSAYGLEQALNEEKFTSSDYAALRALQTGEINQFAGFKWHIIDERDEGGLPIAANIRDCFAWHPSSVGFVVNMQAKTEIEWMVERRSWLIYSSLAMGAKAIDPNGIVKIEITEA